MSRVDIASQPQRGDIVITREAASSEIFTVSQYPGVAQLRAATHAEAVGVAGEFAARHAVDVWYCENRRYEVLDRHRSDVAAQRGS